MRHNYALNISVHVLYISCIPNRAHVPVAWVPTDGEGMTKCTHTVLGTGTIGCESGIVGCFYDVLSAVMIGKNVTEAVICRTRALISKLMSLIAFSGGALHKPLP